MGSLSSASLSASHTSFISPGFHQSSIKTDALTEKREKEREKNYAGISIWSSASVLFWAVVFTTQPFCECTSKVISAIVKKTVVLLSEECTEVVLVILV